MLDIVSLQKKHKELKEKKKALEEGCYLNAINSDGFMTFGIKHLDDREWFISKSFKQYINVQKTNLIKLNQKKDEFKYISFKENNINFALKPTEKIVHFEKNKTYTVQFKGTKQLDADAVVYIILYLKNGKKKNYQIAIGESLQFKVVDEVESTRIAMKLIGAGFITFESIEVLEDFDIQSIAITKTEVIKEDKVSKFMNYVKTTAAKDINKLKAKKDIKIAAILDEFSYECFQHEATLIPITPNDWKERITQEKPAMLLVESAWKGNGGAWAYKVVDLHKKNYTELKDLVKFCQLESIPTVFWDKEGRENIDFFKEAASYFDYIFTSDENSIDKFKKIAGHNKVYPLSFAAQPRMHNPINRRRQMLGKVAFSGSWYGNKHPERKIDMENIVLPSVEFELDIFDRFYGATNTGKSDMKWPEPYQGSIVGKLDYKYMTEAYKNYELFLNVNSIQNSKYMFARRIYELLASKTMVISGDSIGVREQMGDYIYISNSQQETKNILKVLTKNPLKVEREAKKAHRYILQNHTYTHRLDEMLDKIGVEYKQTVEKSVSAIIVTNRPQFMENIYENLKVQTYKNVEHIIVLNSNKMDINKWKKRFKSLPNTKIFHVDEKESLGNCLNFGISKSKNNIIAKIDDDDYYAPNYLLDMVMTFDYTDADIVGKSTHYVYLESEKALIKKTVGNGEDRYSPFISGATIVFKREILKDVKGFEDRNTGEDTSFLKNSAKFGYKIYSNDAFNFCLMRRSNKGNHTWKITDDEILRVSETAAYTEDYKTLMTV